MSELMSAMQLTTFPIIALVLFLLAFAAMVFRLFRSGAKHEHERHSALPLEEGYSTGDASPAPIPVQRASEHPRQNR